MALHYFNYDSKACDNCEMTLEKVTENGKRTTIFIDDCLQTIGKKYDVEGEKGRIITINPKLEPRT